MSGLDLINKLFYVSDIKMVSLSATIVLESRNDTLRVASDLNIEKTAYANIRLAQC